MVNEVMARAITGIDDDLITDAYKSSKKKGNIRFLYTAVSVAACFILIITAVFLTFPKSPAVYLDSEKVTSTPLAVSSPLSVASATPRATQDVTITLDVSLNKTETRISCSQGTFTLCGKNQDTLFYKGTDFTTDKDISKKDLSLCWTVESPEKSEVYTLTLDGKETQVLNLKFDENLNNWTIFIEK